MKKQLVWLFATLLAILATMPTQAQGFDSTQIGKEYPYAFPILGKKAYTRGYKLPKPHGIMFNTLFNKQGIILEDFRMAITQGDEVPNFEELDWLSELIVFDRSEGRISTFNFRADTWIFPFLSVGGYYGRVYGEQTIRLTSPIEITSTTDILGQYWGFNILGIIPAGPVNLGVDWSSSWTTNERLDDPVQVNVVGTRVIKNWQVGKNPDMFIGVWAGAQFQRLDNTTSGKIGMDEALDLDGEKLQEIDDAWEEYMNSPEWDALNPAEQLLREAAFNRLRASLEDLANTTVHYTFIKRLEYEWNMLLGGQWQINRTWQFRTEYGFLKSKQQLMLSLNYRFGL